MFCAAEWLTRTAITFHLHQWLTYFKLENFADDTAIPPSDQNLVYANTAVQNQINRLTKRAQLWRVCNPAKCQHTTFTNCQVTCPKWKIDNTEISQTDAVHYLGTRSWTADWHGVSTWPKTRKTIITCARLLHPLLGKNQI